MWEMAFTRFTRIGTCIAAYYLIMPVDEQKPYTNNFDKQRKYTSTLKDK